MSKRVLLNVGDSLFQTVRGRFFNTRMVKRKTADHENDGEERELPLIHRDTPFSCEIFLVLHKGVRGLSRIYLSGTLEMCNNLIIQIITVSK